VIPVWNGEDISDKSIFLWSDQGLGDTIMLARYIPRIKAKRIVVYTDTAVFRLLRHSLPDCEVLMKGWAFPKCDLHCSFMSLMRCFNLTDVAQIPQGRYLNPPKKHFDLPRGYPRIGINWQGNKSMARDFTRSMPFATFKPILEHGVCVSLQKGAAQNDLAGTGVCDVMDECHDLCDTGSLIDQLDLVISTDTSVPHLAGALGKVTWLLESYESEWRWALGDTAPWYDNVRIFRQKTPGDWGEVIARVKDELRLMTKDERLSA
jgi:hypothetical protein